MPNKYKQSLFKKYALTFLCPFPIVAILFFFIGELFLKEDLTLISDNYVSQFEMIVADLRD